MADKRPHHTLGDYLAIAISPALILALVGSLVFFLLEVLYVGKYEGRLQWILFCFVAATVLIARISMTEAISGRAGLYGLVVAILVYLDLLVFVDYPDDVPLASVGWAVNLVLMALIWWCAHRLTWDCTLVDDDIEATGEGLLQAAGVQQETAKVESRDAATEDQKSVLQNRGSHDEDAQSKNKNHKAISKRRRRSGAPPDSPSLPFDARSSGESQSSTCASRSLGLLAWWDRYQAYRTEQMKKPRNPGVWVVYFSLAALPLFGLGQSLVPAEATDRRRYVFWLMAIYVASGLGLLLATNFLGLRRYLRQRNLKMPAPMTGLWLIMGGIMVAFLLVLGVVLPRPNAEYSLVDLGPLAGSPDRSASKTAVKSDSSGKGTSRASSDQPADDKQNPSGAGKQRAQRGQAETNGKSGQGSSEHGKNPDKNGGRQGQQKGNSSSQGSSQNRSGNQANGQAKKRGGKDKTGGSYKFENAKSSSNDRPSSPLSKFFHWLGQLLKWVVFGVLALVVVIFLCRSGLKYLANFTEWARQLLATLQQWWQNLFGGWGREKQAEAEQAVPIRQPRPVPFAAFQNPFLNGTANHLAPEDVVRYSFDALQALARERGVARKSDETPFEFAERLGEVLPALESQARRLVNLYALAAYGKGRLSAACLDSVRQFWEQLDVFVESPLSA